MTKSTLLHKIVYRIIQTNGHKIDAINKSQGIEYRTVLRQVVCDERMMVCFIRIDPKTGIDFIGY
jgi:hypothetical protein